MPGYSGPPPGWGGPDVARRRMLVRADSGGGTHDLLTWPTKPGRRLAYSVGFTITEDMQDAILQIPARAWTAAYDSDGGVRDGAWVAELTGLLDLKSWPKGMRVIVRRERPHPGAQLRFTDLGGHLRLRLLSAAGRIVRSGRRLRLRLAARWPWATQITAAISRLQAMAPG